MYGPSQDLLPFALSVTGEMTAGEVIVGVGTGALAGFTAWLAARTSREVNLTEQSVGLTRESIEALDRPFVVTTPNDYYEALAVRDVSLGGSGEPERWRFVYRLWNVGKGPAIVYEVSLRASTGGEYLTEERRIERPVAVAPSGRDEAAAFVNNTPPREGESLELRVGYRSASGVRYETRSTVTVEEGRNCICRDFRRIVLD